MTGFSPVCRCPTTTRILGSPLILIRLMCVTHDTFIRDPGFKCMPLLFPHAERSLIFPCKLAYMGENMKLRRGNTQESTSSSADAVPRKDIVRPRLPDAELTFLACCHTAEINGASLSAKGILLLRCSTVDSETLLELCGKWQIRTGETWPRAFTRRCSPARRLVYRMRCGLWLRNCGKREALP